MCKGNENRDSAAGLPRHSLPEGLEEYIENEIIPLYDGFDKAHRREHVKQVISRAMDLVRLYPEADAATVYAAAAFHDTGMRAGREFHHLESGRIIRGDRRLPDFFTPEEIEAIAVAAEDHRASSSHGPRTLCGAIVAEADRQIEPRTIIRRTIQFGLEHEPQFDRAGQRERAFAHLKEKYGRGGYLKLWLDKSDNAAALESLRRIIDDEGRLEALFNEIYDETANS